MKAENKVFIARSLDGYIADKQGGLDWLNQIPNPERQDMGYEKFMEGIDAILMGRRTFDTVCAFDMEWPYRLPVFVMSRTLDSVPDKLKDKAEVVHGSPEQVLDQIHRRGHYRIYVDGGQTVRTFLQEDLIDELIITTIPVLLGGGTPLFTELPAKLEFEHVESALYLDALVQDRYRRMR